MDMLGYDSALLENGNRAKDDGFGWRLGYGPIPIFVRWIHRGFMGGVWVGEQTRGKAMSELRR